MSEKGRSAAELDSRTDAIEKKELTEEIGRRKAEPTGPKPPGLYEKFYVARTDGRSAEGEKHDGCRYFVLDLTHDFAAPAALRAYASVVEGRLPILAADLRREADPPEGGSVDDDAACGPVTPLREMLRHLRAALDVVDNRERVPLPRRWFFELKGLADELQAVVDMPVKSR